MATRPGRWRVLAIVPEAQEELGCITELEQAPDSLASRSTEVLAGGPRSWPALAQGSCRPDRAPPSASGRAEPCPAPTAAHAGLQRPDTFAAALSCPGAEAGW